jgi:hypothetical protein
MCVLSPSYVCSMSVLSSEAGENGQKVGQILGVQHAKKKSWFKTTGYAPPVRCRAGLWRILVGLAGLDRTPRAARRPEDNAPAKAGTPTVDTRRHKPGRVPTHQSYPACQSGKPQAKERKMISDNRLGWCRVQAPRGANSLGGACEGRCVAGSRLQAHGSLPQARRSRLPPFAPILPNLTSHAPRRQERNMLSDNIISNEKCDKPCQTTTQIWRPPQRT